MMGMGQGAGMPSGRLGRHAAAVLPCLVIVAGIDGARHAGLAFPIPFLLLYGSVVAAGALGGKISGGLAGFLAAAFVVYAGFQGFGPRTLTGSPETIVLGGLLYISSGLALGHLRDQRDRSMVGRLRYEVELESQIEARTQSLDRTIGMLRLFEQFSDTSRDLLAMIDDGGRFLVVNRAFCEFFNVLATETIGRKVSDILGLETYNSAIRDPVASGMNGQLVRFDLMLSNLVRGDRWFECNIRPARSGAGGTITAVALGARDITSRRTAERALIDSRDHIRLIADNLPVLITHVDRELRYLFVNATGEEWLGKPAVELLGRTIGDVHGDAVAQFLPNIERVLQGERFTIEGDFVLPGGAVRAMRTSYVPEFDRQGAVPGFFVLAEDFTERKAVERRLAQSQKLEAVGQMTGGIAHDFNNILAVIQGNAELGVTGRAVDAGEVFEQILEASLRGNELIQRLLAFSRRQPLRSGAVDCGELVAGMQDLIVRTLPASVEVETSIAPDIWVARVDRAQLENALLNLVINARDAMPEGGKLRISCRNFRLAAPDASGLPDLQPGDYVVLAVSDTGSGMSAEVIEHAFEPFFTTKEIGEGSGLGLSMVYGFARQSGGHAAIVSEPGRGSRVSLFFPRTTEIARNGDKAVQKEETIDGNGECVLVVEDDANVRRLVIRMLRSLGYDTIEAGCVRAARRALQGNAKIDVVLTDLLLPGGTSGAKLIGEIVDGFPDTGVALMSGFRSERAGPAPRLPDGVPVLAKPFHIGELAQVIAASLAQRGKQGQTEASSERMV